VKVTVVHGDYWDGLYIDGKIVWQHHDLTVHTFMELVGDKQPFEYESIGLDDEQLAHLECRGELPESLVDLDTKWK
jgi:hypothetical protein